MKDKPNMTSSPVGKGLFRRLFKKKVSTNEISDDQSQKIIRRVKTFNDTRPVSVVFGQMGYRELLETNIEIALFRLDPTISLQSPLLGQ
jgi:hypothetical protein